MLISNIQWGNGWFACCPIFIIIFTYYDTSPYKKHRPVKGHRCCPNNQYHADYWRTKYWKKHVHESAKFLSVD